MLAALLPSSLSDLSGAGPGLALAGLAALFFVTLLHAAPGARSEAWIRGLGAALFLGALGAGLGSGLSSVAHPAGVVAGVMPGQAARFALPDEAARFALPDGAPGEVFSLRGGNGPERLPFKRRRQLLWTLCAGFGACAVGLFWGRWLEGPRPEVRDNDDDDDDPDVPPHP